VEEQNAAIASIAAQTAHRKVTAAKAIAASQAALRQSQAKAAHIMTEKTSAGCADLTRLLNDSLPIH